jgi:hypothetical protein
MAQEGEKQSLEPRDTVLLGDVAAHLFDHHIGGQAVGAHIGTCGTEEAALEDILGSLVEFELAPLVGSKQIDKPTRRGHFIGVDLMNGTAGDTFTALDALVTDSGKIKGHSRLAQGFGLFLFCVSRLYRSFGMKGV